MSDRENLGYQFCEFLLEPTKLRLSSKGKDLPLRPKSFELLLYLVERHGQLISKEDLLNKVWPDAHVTEGALRQTIFEIRELLGDHEDRGQLIKTIPKFGYQFVGEVTETRSGTLSFGHWIWPVVAAMLLAAVCLLLFWPWSSPRQPEMAMPSIAVLPFENLSSDPEDEYFSIGITEEIISNLSRIENLRVISRTSVMAYRDTNKRLREIAEELGATAILEGSARQVGGKVRIIVQLIDAESDRHLWSKTYDRSLDDVFAVQSEVARDIAAAMKIRLSPADRERPRKQPAERIDAYNLVLKARHYRYRLQKLDQAFDYYRQAIRTDPSYVVAYAELAEISVFKAIWVLPPGEEREDLFAEAEQMLAMAMELDKTIASPYVSLGVMEGHKLHWLEAEDAFLTALSLNPGHWLTYHAYTVLLTRLGRFEDALKIAKRGFELDPLARFSNSDLALMYLHIGQIDRALEIAEMLRELHPEWSFSYEVLIEVYGVRGQYEEGLKVLAEFREEFDLSETRYNGLLGWVCARTGAAANARKALKRLTVSVEEEDNGPWLAWTKARIYMVLGEDQAALAWLEKSGSWILGGPFKGIAHDPLWDPLRSNPRFQKLLEGMNLPEDSISKLISG